MDSTTFDATTKSFASALTRRTALHGLVAGAVAAIGGGVLVLDEADARKKKRNKPSQRCLTSGKRCETDNQCCSDKGGLICDVPTGGSNSDTYCCGGEGGVCGGANEDGDAVGPKCCANFRCSTGDPDAPGFVPFQKGTCLSDDDDF